MEQDRASPLRLYLPELARQALVSHQVIIQLIAATTTDAGLTVTCDIDANAYPKGVVVTDAEMAAINLEFDPFHGDWNYTIRPTEKPH